MEEAKILIAEDAKVMRQLIVIMLNKILYCNVVETSNGIEAMAKLKEKFDIIFTDINMPEADGLKLIRYVREELNDKDTPIIVITTLGSEHDRDAALSIGATAYITKPVRYYELFKTVKDILG